MTTNLHDKMLKAIDAYFSISDAVEQEAAENLLHDVRDELLKRLAQQSAEPVEIQMRADNSYWAKVDRKTPAEQLAKAHRLMRENPGVYQMRKLYTNPQSQPRGEATLAREWVGLTPEEVQAAVHEVQAAVYDEHGCVVDHEAYASAIEAKLKEKNT